MIRSSRAEMNPVCSSSLISDREVKGIECRHYEACLDIAAQHDWPGFSCEMCNNFLPVSRSAAYWADQAECCKLLLRAVFQPRKFATYKRLLKILKQIETAKDFP